VLFERSLGGVYVDIVPDRDALSRYGLQVDSDVTRWSRSRSAARRSPPPSRGADRFTVNGRYAEDFRSSPSACARCCAVPLR
jgi:Cu(I)/Ag(I) efflux system membrane protein CusA/SilA